MPWAEGRYYVIVSIYRSGTAARGLVIEVKRKMEIVMRCDRENEVECGGRINMSTWAKIRRFGS